MQPSINIFDHPSTDRIFLQSSLCTLPLQLSLCMKRARSSVRRAGLLIDSWIEQEHKAFWIFSSWFIEAVIYLLVFFTSEVCERLLNSKSSMYDETSSFICEIKSWKVLCHPHVFSHFVWLIKIENDKTRGVCKLCTVLVLCDLFQLFILMFAEILFGIIFRFSNFITVDKPKIQKTLCLART